MRRNVLAALVAGQAAFLLSAADTVSVIGNDAVRADGATVRVHT